MKIKTLRRLFLLPVVLLTILLASCDGTVYYSEYKDIKEDGWMSTDSVCFDVQVDDTTHFFDLLVEVRNTVDYAYSNLFLFVNTTFPDGSIAYDTMELSLADPSGAWKGKHSGRFVDSRHRLRSMPVRFPMMGKYHFAVTNGMRENAVKGIEHVGLLVEYSNVK